MPAISIIIAAYNCRQTIGRAIESAQAQTLRDIEIVVGDDASTDGTYEYVQSLAAADPRLKALRLSQNGGASAARNAAIGLSTGEWIAVLDADDWYETCRLEMLLKAATELRADLVCDNLKIYDHAREAIVDQTRYGGRDVAIPLTPEFLFIRDTPLHRHAIGYIKPMVRREFLCAHNVAYNLQYRAGEDFLFLLETLLNGARGFLIPQAYYIYRHRISPTTRKISPYSRSEAGFELIIQSCDYLMQKYGASMTPQAHEALQKKRRIFESRIMCNDMFAAVRKGKLLTAVPILARRPFILVLIGATIAKRIYANLGIYLPGITQIDGGRNQAQSR